MAGHRLLGVKPTGNHQGQNKKHTKVGPKKQNRPRQYTCVSQDAIFSPTLLRQEGEDQHITGAFCNLLVSITT
jgi:hypothetical protein